MRLSLLALVLVLALAARGRRRRPSLPDIEDEVMCVECGTALNVSNSPVANQERAFIREQIAAGQGQEADQGRARRRVRRPDVLAEPEAKGFDLDALDRARSLLVLLVAALGVGFVGAALAPHDGPSREPPTRPDAGPRGRAPAGRGAGDLRPMTDGVDTTIIAAFAVGFVSFISPCVLPLVPGYLSAVSGVVAGRDAARRAAPVARSCCPRSSSASRSRSCSSRWG